MHLKTGTSRLVWMIRKLSENANYSTALCDQVCFSDQQLNEPTYLHILWSASWSGVPDVIKYTPCIAFLYVLMSSSYACCICRSGFTSGLTTADLTEGPVVRECVDEPGEMVSIATLDKTELWRHTVQR